MIIYISLQWGATNYYEAGDRLIKIKWNHKCLPKKGEHISILDFLNEVNLIPKLPETFEVNNKTFSVFEWVDRVNGWYVENWSWKRTNGYVAPHYIVSDLGYLG